MNDSYWTPVPVIRPDRASRAYEALIDRVERLWRDRSQPGGADCAECLERLDALASYLDQPLLPAATVASGFELSQLSALPLMPGGRAYLVGFDRGHIHVFRIEENETDGSPVARWTIPARGCPIGVTFQRIGHFPVVESVVLSVDGPTVYQYRIDISDDDTVTVLENRRAIEHPPFQLGLDWAPDGRHGEAMVLRQPDDQGVPHYDLMVRATSWDPWHSVHQTAHPIHHPLLYRGDLFFVERANEIVRIQAPLSGGTPHRQPLIALDTPVPVQALLPGPADEPRTLLAALADGTIFCIDQHLRKPLWKYDTQRNLSGLALTQANQLVTATPDGLLTLHTFSDRPGIWRNIDRLFSMVNRPVAELLLEQHRSSTFRGAGYAAHQTPPDRARHDSSSGPTRLSTSPPPSQQPPDETWRPHLCLLLVHRILAEESPSADHCSLAGATLVSLFAANEWAGDDTASMVVRFVAYELTSIVEHLRHARPDETVPTGDRRLSTLFDVLAVISSFAHGDARRRIERLIRRLQAQRFDLEVFEHHPKRGLRASFLERPRSLSDPGRWNALHPVLDRQALSDDVKRLCETAVVIWQRHSYPLSRTTLMGMQAAALLDAPEDSKSGADASPIRIAAIQDSELRVYQIRTPDDPLTPIARQRVPEATRLATHRHATGRDLLAVTTAKELLLYTTTDDATRLRACPPLPLTLDEPVTALSFVRLPDADSPNPATALAVGQADGRLRLFAVQGDETGSGPGIRLDPSPILDLHRPHPVHHVRASQWMGGPVLLVDGADTLLFCMNPTVEREELSCRREEMSMGSTVTAFAVARLEKTGDGRPSRILLVGLANGLILAFSEPAREGCMPELCWLYQCSRGVTDLCHIHVSQEDRFVAALDDGSLLVLKNGEVLATTMVERYPTDLAAFQFPGLPQPFLLVSSRAGIVTVLEIADRDPHEAVERILEAIDEKGYQERFIEHIERSGDPVTLALLAHMRGRESAQALVTFIERYGARLFPNRPQTRSLIGTLLQSLRKTPECRPAAYRALRDLLSSPETLSRSRKYVVQALGLLLDQLGNEERALLLATADLDDQSLGRAYLKALEHLWYRFRDREVDPLFWWLAIQHLEAQVRQTVGERHVLPVVGTFCRKLLGFSRSNALASLRYLRRLEEKNIFVTEWVCDALSLPHVVDDPVAQRVARQYAAVLHADSPTEITRALRAQRDLLEKLESQLPGAREAREALEDLLEALDYDDYDDYSRFLVDSPEFLPAVRLDPTGNEGLLKAFNEVRARLSAATPPIDTEEDDPRRFQNRIQVLVAHSEALLAFKRWGKRSATLEQRIVAVVVNRWRQRILRQEIRRLQDAIHIEVRDVRVTDAGDGLAQVSAHIHNLGGHPIDGLMVGLQRHDDIYLWEGSPEWCQGPINFGQSLEYRTEILVDSRTERLPLTFEIHLPGPGGQAPKCFTIPARILRDESDMSEAPTDRWRTEAPFTFESILNRLRLHEVGRTVLLVSEQMRESEAYCTELAQALQDDAGAARRSVLILNLGAMLERPAKVRGEKAPEWWLTHRLAKALHGRHLLDDVPDRGALRSEPSETLRQTLYKALDNTGTLWLVFKGAHRAVMGTARDRAMLVARWLDALATHPSRRIHVMVPADWSTAANLVVAPSPPSRRFLVIDTERPFPPGNPRSEEEHLRRAKQRFENENVALSQHILRKLVEHAGWNLTIVATLAQALEKHRGESWLLWKADEPSTQGEPRELHRFLEAVLPSISRLLKARMRSLPPLHRLALAAVASAKAKVNRKALRPGMVLAEDVMTRVRTRSNRSKRLYPANAVLLPDDVRYLKVTVGDVRGNLMAGRFSGEDARCSISHLLSLSALPDLLSDLSTLGLIRAQTGPNERTYVIGIPLFRRFLVANHPFEPGEEASIRHRLLEGVPMAGRIPLEVYPELDRRLRSARQIEAFLVFLGLLTGDDSQDAGMVSEAMERWDRVVALARRFRAWREKPGPETFRSLVRPWTSLFGVHPDSARVDTIEGILAISVDLRPLRIPRLVRAAVFGAPEKVTFLEAEQLRESLRRADIASRTDWDPGGRESLGFVLVGGGDGRGRPMAGGEDRDLFGERLVRLTPRRIIQTALGRGGRRTFLDLLARSGFQFKHLSPYQLVGPLTGRAMDVLFVGREQEIDEILRNPDKAHAIVGSRKIGKTSLLQKIRQLLATERGGRVRPVFLDCASVDADTFWQEIASAMRLDHVAPGNARAQLTQHLRRQKQPAVLLLDEIDALYEQSTPESEKKAERVMWDLRSLHSAGLIRPIMAGYAKIHELRLSPKSAFHNFTTFIRLGALSPEAARTLIRNPLGALDIQFSSDGLLDIIVERTYRVPWIIQLFCDQLITRLDERLARERRLDRRILREDVDGVAIQTEEQLYTHFTSPRVMSTEQQLMLMCMVAEGMESFTEDDLQLALEARLGPAVWTLLPFHGLHRALDNLTLTLALTVDNGVYSFPLSMYPSIIRNRLGDVAPRVQRLFQELSRS